MPTPDLLTPEVAARARQLEFFARTRVEGVLKGQNWSKLRGMSTEFLKHRLYIPGDDLRRIDWRVSARTDRLVTREYEEFTNLDAVLTLDYSGSMDYRAGGMSKIEFAWHCAAMLAYLFNAQNDRCGVALFADRITDFVPPSTGRKHLAELFRRLVAQLVRGETDLAACVTQLLTRVPRKSVFLFFSDCFQDPQALTRAAGILQIRGHEVVVFHVYDPSETDLNFTGFTQFVDLETNEIDSADPMEIRRAYREVFAEHVRRLKDGFNRHGIEFYDLPVQEDWDLTLAELLHKRARR